MDFEAAGSTLSLAEVKAAIGQTYSNGFGGVWQCEVLYHSDQLVLVYDLAHFPSTKSLVFQAISNSIGGGGASTSIIPISGTHFYASFSDTTPGTMNLRFAGIQNGVPNEQLIGFGLTILSVLEPGYGPGLMAAEAELSDGTVSKASRWIEEGPGAGDTFFGFKAPQGASISSLKFSKTNGYFTRFDDVVIFTGVPEPKISSLRITNYDCDSDSRESGSELPLKAADFGPRGR